jgi:hypothetical protein
LVDGDVGVDEGVGVVAGALAGAEELDLAVAGVAEGDLELAVLDELAAFDPVGRGNGDVQEGAGTTQLATSRAAIAYCCGNLRPSL